MAGQHEPDRDAEPDPPPAPRGTAGRGHDLAQLIVDHALRVGLGPQGRLPTERQLAADLGVTRSSIRYA
ncbi:MAG TPA: hypothetical protein VEM58_14420, partial [Streptosporangiaceae bacterium]|nr:hypothetical protein [Streptosporangiaceae bacterium]